MVTAQIKVTYSNIFNNLSIRVYVLFLYVNLKWLRGNPHPNSCSFWVRKMTDRKRLHLTKYVINYVGLSCSAWTSNGHNAHWLCKANVLVF